FNASAATRQSPISTSGAMQSDDLSDRRGWTRVDTPRPLVPLIRSTSSAMSIAAVKATKGKHVPTRLRVTHGRGRMGVTGVADASEESIGAGAGADRRPTVLSQPGRELVAVAVRQRREADIVAV